MTKTININCFYLNSDAGAEEKFNEVSTLIHKALEEAGKQNLYIGMTITEGKEA